MKAETFSIHEVFPNQYSVHVDEKSNEQPAFTMHVLTSISNSQNYGNIIQTLRNGLGINGVELKSVLYAQVDGLFHIAWSQNVQDHVELEDVLHQMNLAPDPTIQHADARITVYNGQVICWARTRESATQAVEFLGASVPNGERMACALIIHDKNLGTKSLANWKTSGQI